MHLTRIFYIVLGCGVFVGGCKQKPADKDTTTSKKTAVKTNTTSTKPSAPVTKWTRVEETALTDAQKAQLVRAKTAQKALGKSLVGTLTKTMSEGGPTAGITVCNQKASGLTKTVATKHNVNIGRTSHKLRNPNNTAPTWMKTIVESKQAKPQIFVGPNQQLGWSAPIKLGGVCVTCHGTTEQIPTEVQALLKKHYPKDQAVGFKPDDLRGWFWVEVPRT